MVKIKKLEDLSAEEEALLKIYDKLRARKSEESKRPTVTKEPENNQSQTSTASGSAGLKRAHDAAEEAKAQARKLLRAGAIKLDDSRDRTSQFKRSRNLERKLNDPERQAEVRYEPFERSQAHQPLEGPERSFADRDPATVFILAQGIGRSSFDERLLDRWFSSFGAIVGISADSRRSDGGSCSAFVTFETPSAAADAIGRMNGAVMGEGIHLRVSFARHQPGAAPLSSDPSLNSWSKIASRGEKRRREDSQSESDSRSVVKYDDCDIFDS